MYKKYLKYKKKYLNLKAAGSNGASKEVSINNQDKIILCFDFDMTLTKEHSHIEPNKYKLDYNYFGSDIKEIKKYLGYLSENFILCVNSRGNQDFITRYLKKHDLLKFFKYVFGSSDEYPVNADNWPDLKVERLEYIEVSEKVSKNNIYFFDDTNDNITKAISKGYIYSFNLISSEGLLNGIDLLKYLYELFINKYKLIQNLELNNFYIMNQKLFLDMSSTNIEFRKIYILENKTNGVENIIFKNNLKNNNIKIMKNPEIFDGSQRPNSGDIFINFI